MDMIGHDEITADEPRIGFLPRRNKRLMNNRIRETLHPVSGTNREEHDRGLATKNENTFRWMPASNYHYAYSAQRSLVGLDRISP